MKLDALYAPAGRSRLRLTGADRAAFLHNMTTADIKGLAPGGWLTAAIVNQRAQVLDWVDVHAEPDALLVVTTAARTDAVAAWLDKYLITEDVSLARDDAPLTFVTGPDAAKAVEGFAQAWPTTGYGGPGFLVEGDASALDAAGAGRATEAALEARRIAAGVPAADRELTEKVNPWEARLDGAISLAKGCYLGQEVVARLQAYDKVQRLLVGLRFADGELPAPGTALFAEGDDPKAIGEVTSAAVGVGALAFVKRASLEAGRRVGWQSAGGEKFFAIPEDRWFWAPEA